MAEDTTTITEAEPEPTITEAELEPDESKPDASKAAEKYKQQRDDAREQLKDLQEQVSQLQGKDSEIAALQKQLADQADDMEAEREAAALQKLQTSALVAAGCVDVEVALTLLGKEGDVDELKEAKPYLFQAAVKPGRTGAPPAAPPDGQDAFFTKAAEAAGVKKE